mgnify:CR=1 FL=1
MLLVVAYFCFLSESNLSKFLAFSSKGRKYKYIIDEFNELKKMNIIQTRYEEYKKYRDDKIRQRNALLKYEKWNTFAPPLEYSPLSLEIGRAHV